MNRPTFLIFCSALVAITAGIIAQWQSHARLVRELGALHERDRMETLRRRHTVQLPPSDIEIRRPSEKKLAETLPFVGDTAQKPVALGLPAEANSSTSGLTRSESWRNAGRQTPSAAFETLEWALDRGETDSLAASFAFEPEVKIKLDELFAHLSPEVRANYHTPESLIALLVAGTSKGPQAFQVLNESFDGPDSATVRARVQESNGKIREDNFPLRRDADGWKAVISEQQALEKIREFFPEATWRTIEGKAAVGAK